MNGDLRAELELLRDLGYTHLDLVGGSPLAVGGAVLAGTAPSDSPANRQPSTANGLDDVRDEAHDCDKCRLAGTRTNVVFGVGDPNADLMFIGEAPGRDEDEQGEPFVGRAGQLLTDIIKAMKLTRDDVYIANIVKCRPPENRNPEPDEIESCRPFLERQVALIQPKVIVALGKFGLQGLTGKAYSISAVRGQWLQHHGINVGHTRRADAVRDAVFARDSMKRSLDQAIREKRRAD